MYVFFGVVGSGEEGEIGYGVEFDWYVLLYVFFLFFLELKNYWGWILSIFCKMKFRCRG